jgi:hypothetical protein
MRLTLIAALFLLCPTFAQVVHAMQGSDPEWPCMQRKVPNLLPTQFWIGPLPVNEGGLAIDASIADLARDISQRRVPLADAQEKVRVFAAGLPRTDRAKKLEQLFSALFRQMNGERAHMMSGIARYARNQTGMAASVRKESAEIDVLRANSGADAAEVDRRSEALAVKTREFEERVQALTYVCEVPTLIEQRLYALSKTIMETVKAK